MQPCSQPPKAAGGGNFRLVSPGEPTILKLKKKKVCLAYIRDLGIWGV